MAARRGDTECCMCGDYGFSSELFRCKGCQFRSQHRYCSNIYPEDADYYGICNWCLSQKDESAVGKEQKIWNSSGSIKIKAKDCAKTKKKKSLKDNNGEKTKTKTKKHKSLDLSPPSGARRTITTDNGKISRRLRRTRSAEIANGGIKKHVIRNKVVRRYKHLDEVTSN